jgi:hypothetical protein
MKCRLQVKIDILAHRTDREGGPNDGLGNPPTLTTVGRNGFGGFGFLGAWAFKCFCVTGKGLRRLIPGIAALSGNHKPSRTESHSSNVGSICVMVLSTQMRNEKTHVM